MAPEIIPSKPPNFDLDATIASAKAAVSALPEITVFEEKHLRMMRHALQNVCEKLGIHPESDDGREAALAVIEHASEGHADEEALKNAVIASIEKSRISQTAPA